MDAQDSLVNQPLDSLTELPSIMREKLEFCDELDFLQNITPTGTFTNICVDSVPCQAPQLPAGQQQLDKLAWQNGSDYGGPRSQKFSNLENIAEEESYELDNSRLTEKRYTYNELDKGILEAHNELRKSIMDAAPLLEKLSLHKSAGFFGVSEDEKPMYEIRGSSSHVFKDSTSEHLNMALPQTKISDYSNMPSRDAVLNSFLKADRKKTKPNAKVVMNKARRSDVQKSNLAAFNNLPQSDNKKGSFKSESSVTPTANHRYANSTSKQETKRTTSPVNKAKPQNIKIYHSNNIIINIDGKCKLSPEIVSDLLAKNNVSGINARAAMSPPVFDTSAPNIPKNAFAKKKKGCKVEVGKGKVITKRANEKSIILATETAKPNRTLTRDLKSSVASDTRSLHECEKRPQSGKVLATDVESEKEASPRRLKTRKVFNPEVFFSGNTNFDKIRKNVRQTPVSEPHVLDRPNDTKVIDFFEQNTHSTLMKLGSSEYYQDEDLVIPKHSQTLNASQTVNHIPAVKRQSTGDASTGLGGKDNVKNRLFEQVFGTRSTSKDRRKTKAVNGRQGDPLVRLKFPETEESSKETMMFQTISQFEMSTDSLGAPISNITTFPSKRVDSSLQFDSNLQRGIKQRQNFDAVRPVPPSSPQAKSSDVRAEAPTNSTAVHSTTAKSSASSFALPNRVEEHHVEARPIFDKSMLYSMKSNTKKHITDMDFGNLKELRQGYAKRYFNTGLYELKHPVKNAKETDANLKFVMSDFIKGDYMNKSVTSEQFGGKVLKRGSQTSGAGFFGTKYKNSDSVARFSKIGASSVMSNSDLQKMLALNSQIYNKAKQLIKF